MNRQIPITKESDVRETPDSLFRPLHEEFGFTLDVCATAANAKCPVFYTEETDGLASSWRGHNVWCNPPFSEIGAWIAKAWDSGANKVVMLVPATRTEQKWWQAGVEPFRDRELHEEFIETGFTRLSTRFLPGRVHFLENGQPILRKNKDGTLYIDPKSGKPVVSSPKFGCCLLIWQ